MYEYRQYQLAFTLLELMATAAVVGISMTAKDSRDDIVRANNGRFIGAAEDY